jgi:hypothetical protein
MMVGVIDLAVEIDPLRNLAARGGVGRKSSGEAPTDFRTFVNEHPDSQKYEWPNYCYVRLHEGWVEQKV